MSLSRGLNPGFAFVGSLVETVILLYYAAFAASLIVTVGLSSFFATVGVVAGNQTLLDWAASTAEPSGVFWIGTATLVLAALLATGTRRYFSVQKALFALAVAGTLVLVAVLLLGSRDTFKANLTELTGLDYAGVVAIAKQNGYETGSFNLGTSIAFLVFPLLPLLGAVQSIGLGGEVNGSAAPAVRHAGRGRLTGLLIALFDGLAAKAFGYEFQGRHRLQLDLGDRRRLHRGVGRGRAMVHRARRHPDQQRAPATVIMATFVAWIWFWVPAELAYTTRTMIAWRSTGWPPTGSATSASGSTPRWWPSACRPPGRSCSCG